MTKKIPAFSGLAGPGGVTTSTGAKNTMNSKTGTEPATSRILDVVFSNARTFRDDFYSWMVDNVHVYAEFQRRALDVARYRTRYSARTIAEVMRHDTAIRALGDEYKLNGNYVPGMARLFSFRGGNGGSHA